MHEWTGSSTWYHFSHWRLTPTQHSSDTRTLYYSSTGFSNATTYSSNKDVNRRRTHISSNPIHANNYLYTPPITGWVDLSITNADRGITLLETFPRTLPEIEPGTSTNCGTARPRMPCTFYNSRKIWQEDKYSYLLDRRLGGTKSQPGRCAVQKKKPLLIPGIEQSHRDRPARRLGTILTELSWLL